MQSETQVQEAAAEAAAEGFNAGEVIIEHVANTALDHPLIHLPAVAGIDLSVTKHVFMLWVVAALVFFVVTTTIRRYLQQDRLVPTGFMNVLESVVEFLRDSVVKPSVGDKWAATWTPLILTLFVFILFANTIGMVPIFEVLSLVDHWVLHSGEETFFNGLLHGGSTVTANFNVTAALATISFGAIIVAGSRAHGFVQHWRNLAPPGSVALSIILIPIEILGMFVRPFALTMRLAANMTGRPHRDPDDPVVRVYLH